MDFIKWSYFYNSEAPYLEITIGTFALFCLVVIYVRIFGLKSFSKMTVADFASTVAVGSLMASSIVNGTPSLLTGAFAIFIVFLVRIIFSVVRMKSRTIEELTSNKPQFLIYNGEIIEKNLKACNVTHDELRAKLRKSGILNRKEVRYVVFETTGDVHLIKNADDVELDEYIIADVAKV